MDALTTAVGAAVTVATAAAAHAIYRAHRRRAEIEAGLLPTDVPLADGHLLDEDEVRTRAARELLDTHDRQQPDASAPAEPHPERTVVFTFYAPAPAAPEGQARWHPLLQLTELAGRTTELVLVLHAPAQYEELLALEDEFRRRDVGLLMWPLEETDFDDFEQVYAALHNLAEEFELDTTVRDHLVHASAGTPVAQACLVLMAQQKRIPAQLVWTWPPWTKAETHRVRSADLGPAVQLPLSEAQDARLRISPHEEDVDPLLRSRSPRMAEVLSQVEDWAQLPVPLTFLGETGTGKTAVATLAHKIKVRQLGLRGALVARNCMELRGDLARSTLFGHVRGAFTGAVSDQSGWFMEADGGTLFLDEFALMSLDNQGLLLTVLEDGRVTPVGGKTRTSAFHLIVATNRDIAAEVVAGRIREDVMARLGPGVIRLLPLRERTEDIGPTLTLALRKASAIMTRQITILPEASSHYLAYAESAEARWPTNFRELFGSVLEMAVQAKRGVITGAHVEAQIGVLRRRWAAHAGTGGGPVALSALDEVLPPRLRRIDRLEKVMLVDMIHVCQSAPTVSAAGRILYDATTQDLSRPNAAGDRLRKSLQKYGLSFDEIKAGRVE